MTRNWMKDAREAQGLTCGEIAKKLGITESYYRYIEAGVRQQHMDIDLAQRLCPLLGLTLEQLAREEQRWRRSA